MLIAVPDQEGGVQPYTDAGTSVSRSRLAAKEGSVVLTVNSSTAAIKITLTQSQCCLARCGLG